MEQKQNSTQQERRPWRETSRFQTRQITPGQSPLSVPNSKGSHVSYQIGTSIMPDSRRKFPTGIFLGLQWHFGLYM